MQSHGYCIWNEAMESIKDADSDSASVTPPTHMCPAYFTFCDSFSFLASPLRPYFCCWEPTSCPGFLMLQMLLLATHQNNSWTNLQESFQCPWHFSSTAPLFCFLLSSFNSHFKSQNSTVWCLRRRSIRAIFKNSIRPQISFFTYANRQNISLVS